MFVVIGLLASCLSGCASESSPQATRPPGKLLQQADFSVIVPNALSIAPTSVAATGVLSTRLVYDHNNFLSLQAISDSPVALSSFVPTFFAQLDQAGVVFSHQQVDENGQVMTELVINQPQSAGLVASPPTSRDEIWLFTSPEHVWQLDCHYLWGNRALMSALCQQVVQSVQLGS
jgi:hypothetical protein